MKRLESLITARKPVAIPLFWLSCVVLYVLIVIPTDQLPQQLTDWWDKAQHFIAFLFLSLLGCLAYPAKSRLAVPTGLILLGLSMEVVQHFLPWRFGDMADFIADVAGIVTAILLWRILTEGVITKNNP